jgi:hypothetical protein
MQRNRFRSTLWFVVALLQCAGCSSSSAHVTVLLRQGASSSTVAKVQVTVNAPDENTVTADLTRSSNQWTGTLNGLTEGTDRTFNAVALDAGGARLYIGQAAGVALTNGEDTLVFITLDDPTASTTTQLEAPILTSLTAHPSEVRAGNTVTLQATARDRNPGDTIRLEWTAPGGAFSPASNGAITWTAPSSGDALTLGCTATDSQGLNSSLAIPIIVRVASTSSGSGAGTGGACCKHCGGSSKPCGDSCINSSYKCTKPMGCACY